jgi:hypothetical protein
LGTIACLGTICSLERPTKSRVRKHSADHTITFFSLFLFTYLFILPLSLPPPPPTGATFPPPPLLNMSLPPVLRFYRRKNIKDKKRSMPFLLVWDKDSYTGSLLVLFPCICVLQPQLIHFFQSSSLLPSPLPIVAPASLRFLHSFLYSKHINHIQVFGFLPLSDPSFAQFPLNVTHVPSYYCICIRSVICI